LTPRLAILPTALGIALLGAGCGSSGIHVISDVDVSRAAGGQEETAIAVDPRDPNILLAGSNNLVQGPTQVYTSVDGGATWVRKPGPAVPPGFKFSSDPEVAIAGNGREYFSFLASQGEHSSVDRIFVASRPGPTGRWTAIGVSPVGSDADKPAITVDPSSGRVYVSWTVFTRFAFPSLEVAHSDDGGRTWHRSIPVVGAGLQQYSTLAVAPDHTVYLAWDDYVLNHILISRSPKGNEFPQQVEVAGYRAHSSPASHCDGFELAAQPHNCIHSNPSIAVMRDHILVTWGAQGVNGTQDVFQRELSPSLKPEGKPRVVVPDGPSRSDQFWPATAVDPSNDRVWLCFYDTRGDPSRRKVRYSCTDSSDEGKTWARPVPVASVPSDVSLRSRRNEADYGDYEGLAAGHGFAYPIWTDTRNWKPWEEEIFVAALGT
jgi:hypothetical protein